MKVLILIVGLLTALFANAQDTIFKVDGEVWLAKVMEVSPAEVSFKNWQNQDGPMYVFARRSILRIHYADGTIEDMSTTAMSFADDQTLYNRGCEDARKYYQGYKSISTVTLITGITSPIAGLVPAAIGSNKFPESRTFTLPDQNMWSNGQYMNGYRDTAWKIKRKKIWTNFAIGTGVNIGLIIISAIPDALPY